MNPAVSVIIPVRDRERLVAEAVRSVLAQGIEGLEIIVVDDGSIDRSGAAAGACGENVRVFRHESARGPSAARNTGMRQARSEWVAFLDSDDLFLEGSLSSRLEHTVVAGAVLVCADACSWDGQKVLTPRLIGNRPLAPGEDPFRRLLRGNFVLTSTVLARRSTVLEAGGFVEDLWRAEDYHLWLRLARRGAFSFVDTVALRYRVNPLGLAADREGMIEGELQAVRRLLSDPALHLGASEVRAVRDALRRLALERGYEDLVAGQHSAARKRLWRAVGPSPRGLNALLYLAATLLPTRVVSAIRRARGR